MGQWLALYVWISVMLAESATLIVVVLALDIASADTTTASMGTFLMAMIKHPEVQVKAQAELDRVIGLDRLPTFTEYAHSQPENY